MKIGGRRGQGAGGKRQGSRVRGQGSGIKKLRFIGCWSLITVFILAPCYLSLAPMVFAQDNIKESLSELNRILPSKKLVNMPWGRDPFVPLVIFNEGDTNTLAADLSIKLTAIIYNKHNPSAIINDHIVRIGDTINDQKVVDITKQYVILEGNLGQYKLKLGNTEKQLYDIKKNN